MIVCPMISAGAGSGGLPDGHEPDAWNGSGGWKGKMLSGLQEGGVGPGGCGQSSCGRR